MKITGIRLLRVEGTMEFPGEFWEERLVRPVDIYPEHKSQGAGWLAKAGEGKYHMESIFIMLDADGGVTGIGGPISIDQAFLIDTQLKPVVIGEDPLANERIWDKLYRFAIHGRKGTPMMAISALDCAVWDAKGKILDAPLYRLLGGPTRPRVPAYASALGYSLEPSRVRERAQMFVQQGYRAMKWFFREGPYDAKEGIEKNVQLARTLREAVGPDVDIMLDAWSSWDLPYAKLMAERIAEYRPRWIEEPCLADKIDTCAAIHRAMPFPVATGEHEYTRWGLKQLMDADACDVLQPDIYWAGGITEMVKICTLASTYDLPVIPHGHSVPATTHLILSQPVNVCPLEEYLVKWNTIHQFFLKNPISPIDGFITPSDVPGIGMDLDEAKIEKRKELSW